MKKYLSPIKRYRIYLILLLIAFVALGGVILYNRKNQVMPQVAYYFLKDVSLPNKEQKVLIYSPHQDDETIATGGYIYESRKRGADVKIVLVTNGNKHHLQETRYQEFKSATKILGVDENSLVFLGFPDGKLNTVNQDQLFIKLNTEFENFNPDFVFYPDTSDTHPDHAAVGKAVEEIISKKSRATAYKYLVHHPKFPQPKKLRPDLYLLPPNDLVKFDSEWQRFTLSNEAETVKLEALKSYRSQLKVPLLRSLMFSSIRKNELFRIGGKND